MLSEDLTSGSELALKSELIRHYSETLLNNQVDCSLLSSNLLNSDGMEISDDPAFVPSPLSLVCIEIFSISFSLLSLFRLTLFLCLVYVIFITFSLSQSYSLILSNWVRFGYY
jgi:hypothetical protein